MTDTKDDEVKQTAWEAGFEAGWKAAKKNDNYSKCYELYLMAMERRRRETAKINIDLPLEFPLPPIERGGGEG